MVPGAPRFYTPSHFVPLVLTNRLPAANKASLELYAQENRAATPSSPRLPVRASAPCVSLFGSRQRFPRRDTLCITALLGLWPYWPRRPSRFCPFTQHPLRIKTILRQRLRSNTSWSFSR